MLHHYLKGRAAASPQGAKLFFIPVYIGQFYHSLRESFNFDHWAASNQTSQLVLQAITWYACLLPVIKLPEANGRLTAVCIPAHSQLREVAMARPHFTMFSFRPSVSAILPGSIENVQQPRCTSAC